MEKKGKAKPAPSRGKAKPTKRPKATTATETAPAGTQHIVHKKSNIKFEISQLYYRVRRERDGKKKTELHRKLMLLKKLAVQRKDNHCKKALLQAIKKQKKREAQLMGKRLARWKKLAEENKTTATPEDHVEPEIKLPSKEELERVEKQVAILKALQPEDFMSWLGRTYRGKTSKEPVDTNKEAVIKRILKAKFVREEYEKMKAIKEKKRSQKEKRTQRLVKRKRKRTDLAETAGAEVEEGGLINDEAPEEEESGVPMALESNGETDESLHREKEESEEGEEEGKEDDLREASLSSTKGKKEGEERKQKKKQTPGKLASVFVSSLNGSAVEEDQPIQKKRRVMPPEDKRKTERDSFSLEQKRIHPSWEAKKKAKDKQALQKFEGKKIKFD